MPAARSAAASCGWATTSPTANTAAFLSFDTASLPDTAVIRKATVKAMRSGITGINPATTHGGLSADVKTGFFGASTALENADFADPATAAGVSLLTPAAANGGWTEGVFDAAGRAAIGLTGITQVRLQLEPRRRRRLLPTTTSTTTGASPPWPAPARS